MCLVNGSNVLTAGIEAFRSWRLECVRTSDETAGDIRYKVTKQDNVRCEKVLKFLCYLLYVR